MKLDSRFLRLIVFIPAISTLLFLFVALVFSSYSYYKEHQLKAEQIRQRYIQSKKDILKNRVEIINDLISIKQNDKALSAKEAKKQIKDYINLIRFEDASYIFVYSLLDINGGDKFAVMEVNPNRKDLEGKYISDEYKDAKGKRFRKKFLEDIRKNGESFTSYYYKKPDSESISKKLSYFRLEKEWNWIIASGIYIDEIEKTIQKEQKYIYDSIERNTVFMSISAFFILVLSVLSSLYFWKIINRALSLYKEEVLDQNRRLKQMVYIDELTGKRNRKALVKEIEKNSFDALILVDIDEFKLVNELYGGEAGNIALKKLVELLEKFDKDNECEIFRVGSDEFVMLLSRKHDFDIGDFEFMIVSLRDFISNYEMEISKDVSIKLEITIGISLEKEDALTKAEIALKTARERDNKFLSYSLAIDDRDKSHESVYIKQQLTSAIKNDLVTPFFQPIVDKDKKILKYEALIRLKTDQKDVVISPNKFLDIAKKLKVYPELSKIMIQKSFERFKDEEVYFSVNLSMLDIINTDTIHFIESTLHQNKQTAKRLVFEILESEGIDDFEILMEFVGRMRSFGVKIAIDDFGSGYSSFKYILKIKPDFIKIDGSLVEHIDSDQDSKIMVKTIVNVSRDMNAKTVAEYVHKKEVFDELVKLGVDEFQGYYISKPSEYL